MKSIRSGILLATGLLVLTEGNRSQHQQPRAAGVPTGNPRPCSARVELPAAGEARARSEEEAGGGAGAAWVAASVHRGGRRAFAARRRARISNGVRPSGGCLQNQPKRRRPTPGRHRAGGAGPKRAGERVRAVPRADRRGARPGSKRDGDLAGPVRAAWLPLRICERASLRADAARVQRRTRATHSASRQGVRERSGTLRPRRHDGGWVSRKRRMASSPTPVRRAFTDIVLPPWESA
jgi:hypothetical protein